ncbi:MAG: hypothetical protein JSW54_03170 [Fidelibacterota bacterium]|nr:MAG: hypothetical protein JSW54_03170 [Candidatus Neomarinimicrobiota bacterium]
MTSRLRQILLQQRDAVADILHASQAVAAESGELSAARLEELLRHRAEYVQIIEQLESERQELIKGNNGMDTTLQPLQKEIQEALQTLAALDKHLSDMVFKAQLELTNNLAFAPKFVNLGRNAAEKPHTRSRVVDITR